MPDGAAMIPDPEQRMRFVMTLRASGVIDAAVLGAMEAVDRADFVGEVFRERAYDNTPLPIEAGQTISQPAIVGIMSQALRVERRHVVLEVGTGSAYQTAILARLSRWVHTVERHAVLHQSARQRIEAMDLRNVTAFEGDGGLGLPHQAPFDRIMVTAAADDPPGPLLAQLREGGIMVLPVNDPGPGQTLIRVTRTKDGFDYEDLGPVRFVPLVPGRPEED